MNPASSAKREHSAWNYTQVANEESESVDNAPDWQALITPETILVLDFDETYWLRNSTEAFLDSARPAWLAAFVLKALDVLRPWRLLPAGKDGKATEHVWRDWLRVMLVVILFPWTLLRWPRLARQLGPQWLNATLARLAERVPAERRWIVTNGFGPIVAPLVAALGEPHRARLLASPLLTGFAWRRRGKVAVVAERLDAAQLARTVVVTDNDEDADLLAAVGHPVHHKWPEARFEPAHENAYLPFHYLEQVKRPGQRYLVNVVIKEELALVLLIYLWASFSLAGLLAAVLLYASLWVTYEVVYFENDRVAALREADPVLSQSYFTGPNRFSERGAWAVGLALGLAGLSALQWAPHAAGQGLAQSGLLWLAWLLGLRAVVYVYNHVDKQSRVVLYLPLQSLKLLALSLCFPLPVAGGVLLAAHLAIVWVPYIAYRQPGGSVRGWQAPNQLFRLELAALLAVLALVVDLPGGIGGRPILDGSSQILLAVGLCWFAVRARHEIARLWTGLRWLQPRNGPNDQPSAQKRQD